MLGLGLRSSQSPGVSGSAPLVSESVITTFIGEDFNGSSNVAWGIGSNPFSNTQVNARAADITDWAQGHECVAGVTIVDGDPTSTEGWGTMVLSDGITYNAQACGWQVDSGETPSSGTGPIADPISRSNNNPNPSPTPSDVYLYTEGSSTSTGSGYRASNQIFITRTPGVNFSQSITSASNDIRVSFQVHGYGSRIGNLRLYIDDSATSTEADCAEIYTQSTFTQEAEQTVPWTNVEFTINVVDLPDLGITDLRTADSTFYIYIVHEPDDNVANEYTCDLGIDNFYVEEIG